MAFDLSSLKNIIKKDVGVSSSKESFLGVDIGSSAIKIVQLKSVKGVPTLETYGELQLGPYEGIDIGRDTHLSSNKITEALVDIMREASATSINVAYAFPYNGSFTQVISIPTLDETKIASMLPIEARKFIPISLTKVSLDWVVLGTSPEERLTKVLLSAIYTQAIQKYGEIIQGAGLKERASEIEVFSSLRSIVSPADDVVIIIDLGASSTRLYIIEKGIVQKTHSVLFTGGDVTNALSQALGIEYGKAEEMKRSYGIDGFAGTPEVQSAIIKIFERGFREFHMVISRYESEQKKPIQKIFFTGGASLLRGLAVYAQDMFSREILFASPFEKVAYPAFLEDTLKDAGPSFAVAVGVALRALQQNEGG